MAPSPIAPSPPFYRIESPLTEQTANRCLHTCLSLLTGCGNFPYPPGTCQALPPDSRALGAFNKPDLWKTCAFVCRCVLEGGGRCRGGLNPRPDAGHCFSCCCRRWCPLAFEGPKGHDEVRPTPNLRVRRVPVAWFCHASGCG